MTPKSPMCVYTGLIKSVYDIAKEHGLDYKVMLAISYKESHLGTSFAPKRECSKSNNRGGIKTYIKDDGSKIKKYYTGCRLYPFASVEEYFHGLANSLKHGYVDNGCDNLECLAKYYVGTPGIAKPDYVRHLQRFINKIE